MNETERAQEIWQSQPVEGVKMSVEAIQQRAQKFERRMWRRNLRESIAGLVAIVAFSYFFVRADEMAWRITWGLFIAGMIWVVVQIWRKGSPRKMPGPTGNTTGLEFFRKELARQRDLVKDVWTWYLVPLVPGYVAFNVAHALTVHSWGKLALLDLFFAGVFAGTWRLNLHAARCLQRSIDGLPAVEIPAEGCER
jgi:hypothetical protein